MKNALKLLVLVAAGAVQTSTSLATLVTFDDLSPANGIYRTFVPGNERSLYPVPSSDLEGVFWERIYYFDKEWARSSGFVGSANIERGVVSGEQAGLVYSFGLFRTYDLEDPLRPELGYRKFNFESMYVTGGNWPDDLLTVTATAGAETKYSLTIPISNIPQLVNLNFEGVDAVSFYAYSPSRDTLDLLVIDDLVITQGNSGHAVPDQVPFAPLLAAFGVLFFGMGVKLERAESSIGFHARSLVALAFLVCFTHSMTQAADLRYAIQQVTPPEGIVKLNVWDINDAGQVILTGRKEDEPGFGRYNERIFIWERGNIREIETPVPIRNDEDSLSHIYCLLINNSSQILVSIDLARPSPATQVAYIYEGGKYSQISDSTMIAAADLNDNGDVVGLIRLDESHGQVTHSFLYSDGQLQVFPPELGTVTGVNNRQEIAGWRSYIGSSGTGVRHGFLHRNGNVTLLDQLGNYVESVSSVNNNGEIIGSAFIGASEVGQQPQEVPHEGFVYRGGTMERLGDFMPKDINDWGTILGAVRDVSNTPNTLALNQSGETKPLSHFILSPEVELNANIGAVINNRNQVAFDGQIHSAQETRQGAFVLTPAMPPIISLQPRGQSAAEGSDVTFEIAAEGTGPLTYQWRFDGKDLIGKTNYTLKLKSVLNLDVGDYTVVVSGPGGSTTSEPAHLSIGGGPEVPTTLTLQFYAGVTIMGISGKSYRIEYSSGVADEVSWFPLEIITMTNTTQTFIDFSSPNNSKRFYRAVDLMP